MTGTNTGETEMYVRLDELFDETGEANDFDPHFEAALRHRAEIRDEIIEALTTERDALIRDRDRWAQEAQVNTSPIVAGLIADRARLRAVLTELLQVSDGVPMFGIEASRRIEAARTELKGQQL